MIIQVQRATTLKPNCVVLHNRADDLVSFAESEKLDANSGLPPKTLIEVVSDHRLAVPERLKTMLEARGHVVDANQTG